MSTRQGDLRGVKFIVPKGGYKKYTAIIPLPNGKTKRVSFGDRRYEHFKDRVPKRQGGGQWSNLDHNDRDRRTRYRSRHTGIKTKSGKPAYLVKYSPAWFSMNYLW